MEPLLVPEPGGERAACRVAHCGGGGTECSYVDRRGRRCATHWCRDHAVVVARAVYCRRHAGTLAALGAASRGLANRPAVDNRAASLTGFVAAHLDDHIRSLLACLRAFDELLVADACISACDDGHRALRWHRGWSLVSPHGISTRVVVEISEEDDAMVWLTVGRVIVFAGVPPWIAWHRMGLTVPGPVDLAARKTFYDRAKCAVADELVRRRLGLRTNGGPQREGGSDAPLR